MNAVGSLIRIDRSRQEKNATAHMPELRCIQSDQVKLLIGRELKKKRINTIKDAEVNLGKKSVVRCCQKRVSTLSWVCMHRLGGENISQFEAVAWDRGHCLSIRKKMTPIGGRCAIDMSMKIENRSHGWPILSLRMRHLSSNPLLPYTCDA